MQSWLSRRAGYVDFPGMLVVSITILTVLTGSTLAREKAIDRMLREQIRKRGGIDISYEE